MFVPMRASFVAILSVLLALVLVAAGLVQPPQLSRATAQSSTSSLPTEEEEDHHEGTKLVASAVVAHAPPASKRPPIAPRFRPVRMSPPRPAPAPRAAVSSPLRC
jgi:hypothetical protein